MKWKSVEPVNLIVVVVVLDDGVVRSAGGVAVGLGQGGQLHGRGQLAGPEYIKVRFKLWGWEKRFWIYSIGDTGGVREVPFLLMQNGFLRNSIHYLGKRVFETLVDKLAWNMICQLIIYMYII